MRILAIDPGTKTGWALMENGQLLGSGVWQLATDRQRRYEGGGMRYVRLRRCLDEIGHVDLVVYEEIRRHMGVDAAHVYGGCQATITAWCESQAPPVPYEAVPVAHIKKHATGKGNADKPAMIAAAIRFGVAPEDDNEADAVCLGMLAAEQARKIA